MLVSTNHLSHILFKPRHHLLQQLHNNSRATNRKPHSPPPPPEESTIVCWDASELLDQPVTTETGLGCPGGGCPMKPPPAIWSEETRGTDPAALGILGNSSSHAFRSPG